MRGPVIATLLALALAALSACPASCARSTLATASARSAVLRSASAMPRGGGSGGSHALARRKRKKKVHPYTSPSGLFIQEFASKMLPGPGQHFSFGALKPWEDIVAMLDDKPDRKLLLMVRHGQAVSNYLQDLLGPDEWYQVEGTCAYTDKNSTKWNLFDAELSELGVQQADALNTQLSGGGWYAKMSGGRPARLVVSPLSRCLHTAELVMKDLRVNATVVEETVRETLGRDTCDARRSASDPNHAAATRSSSSSGGANPAVCSYDQGLVNRFPQFRFRVYDGDERGRGFGLEGDEDQLWTADNRERQAHQVRRAKRFLDILFDHAPEQVIVLVTHSGFARSLLLAVRREPYRPMNAELVPVIVDKERVDEQDEPLGGGERKAAAGLFGRAAATAEDDVLYDGLWQGDEDGGDGQDGQVGSRAGAKTRAVGEQAPAS